MSFPDRIPSTGGVDLGGHVFQYFKDALADRAVYPNGDSAESWPLYTVILDPPQFSKFPTPVIGAGVSFNFPMTRGSFYALIDYFTKQDGNLDRRMFQPLSSGKHYGFAEPVSGWSIKNVTDWGKIKTMELAIFGSVGNGADLNSQSLFTSGTILSSIPSWSIYDMNYLRYGLVQFPSYGSCHTE